jgi:hypothetical protein
MVDVDRLGIRVLGVGRRASRPSLSNHWACIEHQWRHPSLPRVILVSRNILALRNQQAFETWARARAIHWINANFFASVFKKQGGMVLVLLGGVLVLHTINLILPRSRVERDGLWTCCIPVGHGSTHTASQLHASLAIKHTAIFSYDLGGSSYSLAFTAWLSDTAL